MEYFARRFKVKMKNGDTFKSTVQYINKDEKDYFIKIFKHMKEMNYFTFDSIYMNGSEISSIEMVKPWWASK
jgi:hypothetical protein